jgi:hypothetical protein
VPQSASPVQKPELDEDTLILKAAILTEKYPSSQSYAFYLELEEAVVAGDLMLAHQRLQKFQHFAEQQEQLNAWDELRQQPITHDESQNALYL